MNVLVYSGPEVLQTSLSRSLILLRSLLLPNYTVQPINPQSLASHPWPATCALLVFPALRERLTLTPATSGVIRSFVENGGTFLGLRAGIKTAGSALAIIDPSEYTIRFQDQTSGTGFAVALAPSSDDGVHPVTVVSDSGDTSILLEAERVASEISDNSSANLFARYADTQEPAAVAVRIGKGNIALLGPFVERPLEQKDITGASVQDVNAAEQKRLDLVKQTLRLLGLQLPSDSSSSLNHPLPQILTASPNRPDAVQSVLNALEITSTKVIKDENDSFEFVEPAQGESLLQQYRTTANSPPEVNYITYYTDSTLPSKDITPLFTLSEYYSSLSAARERKGCPSAPSPWGFGDVLLYGEVVTSTQTLLDKNPKLLTKLPTPFLALASHQIAGRGRSGNTWVSPSGCLQFSLLLRVPLSALPGSKLVFIQYLFALAVVEACRDQNVLGALGEQVRLKWPNDIYVVEGEQKRKVGGILVNTSFSGGEASIVIGCGLNVLNGPPIASLSQLLPEGQQNLTMEKTLSTIMATFEPMWNTFVAQQGSFNSFMDLYLERWLHS
ncbi:class II aaRS and biotin synthetase [Panus rudis PR-1116 ss-1]|nr:class II aaRS and biotin synthetase [Panus rudis PR-1116 ss-1]